MKIQFIKIISIVLMLVMSFLSLTSCDYLIEHFVTERPENRHYGAVKTLYSYDDVMKALDIVRQRMDVEPRYTVDDMGEDYIIFYQFVNQGMWADYPIDYENYFTTMSNGYFLTYIFIKDQSCPGHEPQSDCIYSLLCRFKQDEDYNKLTEAGSMACVCVFNNRTLSHIIYEIEDTSLLSYRERKLSSGYEYFVYYDEEEIMDLYSCVMLDETFFEKFFDSIVTTRVE